MRGMGHVAHMGMKRNSYGILMGKSEGRSHLHGKDYMVMWRDVMNAVMNLRVSWNVENFLPT